MRLDVSVDCRQPNGSLSLCPGESRTGGRMRERGGHLRFGHFISSSSSEIIILKKAERLLPFYILNFLCMFCKQYGLEVTIYRGAEWAV